MNFPNRNDVDGALRYATEKLDAGTFSTDDGEVLDMLQDDPEKLRRALSKLFDERERAGKNVDVVDPTSSARRDDDEAPSPSRP